MKPILQSLLLADHVYTDQATGKKIIAGIFHTLNFKPIQIAKPDGPNPPEPTPPEPATAQPGYFAGSPMAYISLTEIREATTLDLRYVDLEDNSILFGANITLRLVEYDPLATAELVVALPVLPIPHKGHYALELLHGGELIGAHRIQAIEIQEG